MTASAENFLKAAQQLERLNLDLALSAGEFADDAIDASLARDRGHATETIRRGTRPISNGSTAASRRCCRACVLTIC